MAEPTKVTVPVEPAVWSKINWAQVLGLGATVATMLGWTVPPDLVPATVVAIQSVVSVATIVLRTWFTKSVTPSSATKV